jgi:ribosomal-protein-alanine N-acetyltransferase
MEARRVPPPAPPAGSIDGERIRSMVERDVERVAELEAHAFGSPWEAATFRRLLGRSGAELLVVEVRGELVGYAVLWCILDQGELANIAVDPGWQRRGIGSRLLERVLQRARERGVRDLFLEVRESNGVARELYGRRGFLQIGVRRDYYDSPREDACVLRLEL